ncbi:MAG: methylamine utilization protein [Proteobacteria bacterium]|nr:methylamine utilization protein [Pseudomonadota bacterium]
MHRHNFTSTCLVALAMIVGARAHAAAPAITGTVSSADGAPVTDAVVFVQSPVPEPEKSPPMQVVDQVNKTFVPGLLPIVVGTAVRFPNHDQIHHHVYSFSPTKTFELPLYKGEAAAPVVFDKVGAVKIGCNIHDWMSGIILVLPSRHFAVTDSTGRFTLNDLPAGTYTLVAWHARSKLKPDETAQSVQVGAEVANLTFKLPLAPPRPRPAMHGTRAEP